MSLVGIIAEFNPFHLGHEHIINEVRSNGDTVVCALSGNFVQRGDVAVISKKDRTRAALSARADIVVEIPTAYSMSTAQSFALAGVWQLYNTGCDTIAFGSECGNADLLQKTADILCSEEFTGHLCSMLKGGDTFAAIREKAAEKCGADISLLRSANDNLGIEYMIAAKKLGKPMKFKAIKRVGALHDSLPEGAYASGSYLRELIKKGDLQQVKKYMPQYSYDLLLHGNTADIGNIDRAILALLRSKKREEFKNLPDTSEGIENRLFEAMRSASSLEELFETVKTKRYTMARVRRLVLSAALGINNGFFLSVPPYTRILGASTEGLKYIKSAPAERPIVTKSSEIEMLSSTAKKLFMCECRATDLYSLALSDPEKCGNEYTFKFIKI